MIPSSKKTTLAIMLGLAVLTCVWLGIYAGSLEPPGAPAPTTTAVDETDPRTPIRVGDLPLTIFSSGSYYLAEDISTGGDGITVDADNVTIDLMGFSLRGGTGFGISATAGRKNLQVRNGTVSDWTFGGMDLHFAESSVVINVRAKANGGIGIHVGSNTVVVESTAVDNDNDGIRGSASSSISGCTALRNGGDGIRVENGSTVTACAARDNVGDGIDAIRSTVTGCSAYSNDKNGIRTGGGSTVTDCTVYSNGEDGISSFGAGDSIRGSTAYQNTGDGIQVINAVSVVGNTCHQNGFGAGDGAGIHVTGSDNRIDGNNATGNDRGIDVDTPMKRGIRPFGRNT